MDQKVELTFLSLNDFICFLLFNSAAIGEPRCYGYDSHYKVQCYANMKCHFVSNPTISYKLRDKKQYADADGKCLLRFGTRVRWKLKLSCLS